MLFYEKLDPFVVRTENSLEPLKRFMKQHLASTARQIVGIGNDLLFRGQGYIFLAGKSKPRGLGSGNARSNMAFNDQHDGVRKTEALRDLYACYGMFDTMRPGPADIMEQSPEADQFPVNRPPYPFNKGDRHIRDLSAVRNNFRRAAGLYQHINPTHKPVNNTIIS